MNFDSMTNRRQFLKSAGLAASALCLPGCVNSLGSGKVTVPSYLSGYEELYKTDPHEASLEWFRNAGFALFMHYGLYSAPGKGEWVQFFDKIHVAEYEKLKDTFTAEGFDADFITDLALEAQMKYVTIVSMHHDGFCLFDTKQTDFNSVNSPAKRDLVAELAEQCHKKGLGLGLYYSHGRHWRHRHAMNNETYGSKDFGVTARPLYSSPDPYYATGEDHDISKYVTYCKAQVRELLTNYGPVAYVWFDGWGTPMAGPWEKELHVPELYAMIRELQPHCLISYKWGLTGTEDFFAPEIHWLGDKARTAKAVAEGKPFEICTKMSQGWSYIRNPKKEPKNVQQVLDDLAVAAKYKGNLLMNVAPLPDGSIAKHDTEVLKEVGQRLRQRKSGS